MNNKVYKTLDILLSDIAINKFYEIVNNNLSFLNIDKFILLSKNNNKISFKFGNDENLYFCSINKSIKNISKIIDFKKRNLINRDITIYEDNDGFLIQKCVNTDLNFNSVNVQKKVLNKLREIHMLQDTIDIHKDPTMKYMYLNKINNSKNIIYEINKRIFKLNNKFIYSDYYKETICHCDFHCKNLAELNDNIYVIDWDLVRMYSPIYDICYFLISFLNEYNDNINNLIKFIQELYNYLPNILDIYYNRKLNNDEYRYHLIMYIICEYMWLASAITGNRYDNKDYIINIYNLLDKHIYDNYL